MIYRLPRLVELPWSYSATVVRGQDCGDAWGDWDPSTRVIALDKMHKNTAQLRHTFLHEMEHFFKDWLRWVPTVVPIENPDKPEEVEDGEEA